MARRSPTNQRYRQDGVGKTRKSAASAKPKRSAGDVSERAKSASKGGGEKKRRWFEPLPTPDTPEFKRWRRIWAGLFVAGAILSVFALLQRDTQVGTWSLIAAYSFLFSAIYVDITKVRRMRKAYLAEQQGGGKKA